jgi:hypothetical protein
MTSDETDRAHQGDGEMSGDLEAGVVARSRQSEVAEDEREPLLEAGESEPLRSRWSDIQARFVDEPQRSVEDAHRLVGEVMEQLQRTFSEERRRLERVWEGGDDVSTEDLRLALTRYRSFFNRLLST